MHVYMCIHVYLGMKMVSLNPEQSQKGLVYKSSFLLSVWEQPEFISLHDNTLFSPFHLLCCLEYFILFFLAMPSHLQTVTQSCLKQLIPLTLHFPRPVYLHQMLKSLNICEIDHLFLGFFLELKVLGVFIHPLWCCINK